MAASKLTYAPGHAPSHIANHAMRNAFNSAAYLLPSLATLSTTNPNLALLDCGAGPGTITASLAQQLPSTARVVATDISADVLSRAAAHAAEQGLTNLTTQEASIYDLAETFGAESFDVVHAHQVLSHLTDPLTALKSMLRVCKPGGLVAVREADLLTQVFHPSTPGLVAARECLMKYHPTTGGNVSMGTQLLALALKAGVPKANVAPTMDCMFMHEQKERAVLGGAFAARCKESPMRKVAIEKGWYTEAEMDEQVKAWEEWVACEDGAVWGIMNGEIIITKP